MNDANGNKSNSGMNVFEYAVYRTCFQMATPEERETLDRLVQKIDAGDKQAGKVLKLLVFDILLDGDRRPAPSPE